MLLKYTQIKSKSSFLIFSNFFALCMEWPYRVHQDQNFYKLNYQLLMKARHVQSTQKRKLVKLLQYNKEKYCNCFCVLLWGKNIQILYRVPIMFVVACFCKHSNCPNFARTVLAFGMLSQCHRLNLFVLVFTFLTKKMFIFT